MDETVFAITKAMLGASVFGISVFLIKRGVEEKILEMKARRDAFTAHIATCEKKNTDFALLKQKVDGMAAQAEADVHERRWLGDCVVAIGSKMDVHLPERP